MYISRYTSTKGYEIESSHDYPCEYARLYHNATRVPIFRSALFFSRSPVLSFCQWSSVLFDFLINGPCSRARARGEFLIKEFFLSLRKFF